MICYSKDGYLFDKEAILQYIITKKTEHAKKLKEYERQKQLELNEANEANALEEQKKLMKFINTEKNVITPKGLCIKCHLFEFIFYLFDFYVNLQLVQVHRAFPTWPMEEIKSCQAFGFHHNHQQLNG